MVSWGNRMRRRYRTKRDSADSAVIISTQGAADRRLTAISFRRKAAQLWLDSPTGPVRTAACGSPPILWCDPLHAERGADDPFAAAGDPGETDLEVGRKEPGAAWSFGGSALRRIEPAGAAPCGKKQSQMSGSTASRSGSNQQWDKCRTPCLPSASPCSFRISSRSAACCLTSARNRRPGQHPETPA